MRQLLITAVCALSLVGFGSKALGPQEAAAQPAVAVDGEGAQRPAVASTDPASEGDAPRGTVAPAAGGSASAGANGKNETSEDQQPAGDLASKLFDAVRAGKWGIAFGLALLLLIAGLRTAVLGSWIPWFKTRIGGYALAFATAAGAVIGVAHAASVGFSLGLLGAALWAGAGAIGLHQGQKDFRAWWAARKAA